jgi:hypothetical protein
MLDLDFTNKLFNPLCLFNFLINVFNPINLCFINIIIIMVYFFINYSHVIYLPPIKVPLLSIIKKYIPILINYPLHSFTTIHSPIIFLCVNSTILINSINSLIQSHFFITYPLLNDHHPTI